ncbi:Cytochrome b-c1 complex subunit 2,mitochondrial [Taphrina deformans PYCC 5710]|uniref:Cytochrome b-c1 complex subunit 2, mitochondrial n=1 Tax=Taphrina deformans (strain PYCC 5710 / ATCC 11124 / CBS 356.35 / IMI 108563 / JCM 9778 / NBRC 8474) TaxID=1097556 RepID=R4X6C4_TAPDE|nr:Cytochrome b-c1 complex subunit 2,mitochondrial [Taphrina deformans PYCC 5710]|eukprot:CCG80565.1 Cytochrome b-c1 complex subunit 2,mitochondrial [Taphrina deformans PYCC 5710]
MFSSKALLRQASALSKQSRSMATEASQAFSFSVRDSAGIKVASRDDGRPTTSLSVVIKAGARYEPAPGVAHVLEKFAFQNTEKRSALRITRESELIGANLSSQVTREHIILNAQFLREDLPYFTDLLGEVLSKTKYNHYTLPEQVAPLCKLEYKSMMNSPPAIAADAVHNLAFRRGLGNTILAENETDMNYKIVKDYAAKSYVKQNIAIVATGADAAELDELVAKHFKDIPSGTAAQAPATKYFGGEIRVPFRSNVGHFVVGFPGGAASPHTPAEFTVLGNLLGGMSSIKWSVGNSILGQTAAGLNPASKAIANHGAYSDAGLFTIYVMGPTATVGSTAKAALDALKQVSQEVKPEDLKRAIAQSRFNAYAAAEERTMSAEAIGRSILLSGKSIDVEAIVKDLEKVSAETLKKAAKSLLESKPSVAVVGETHSLPYYDEL